jgi:hypothetical protein
MHCGRVAFHVPGEPIAEGCPAGARADTQPKPVRFGRLFDPAPEMSDDERKVLKAKLIDLGLLMNAPQAPLQDDGESDIPSGYTYLGQFIAHEITFDSTGDKTADGADFENLATPHVDLDSLYGGKQGPSDRPELYEGGALLKVGDTKDLASVRKSFKNDLRRGAPDDPKKALIGDPRNDENLPLAQTHLAFIRFHNKVVETLDKNGHDKDSLFECARALVTRHFQWIVLYDYLPRLVDKEVLDCVLRHGCRWFKPAPGELFMPLEFSAAAFRIGHSMVRRTYQWNDRHSTKQFGDVVSDKSVGIAQLFDQTARSGNLGGPDNHVLMSDWVIDWRRFYDFTPLGHIPPPPKINMASKLDTNLNFRLNSVVPSGGDPADDEQAKSISVRNLRRGFYLRLPTGEEVAKRIGETPLKPEEVAAGPHHEKLSDPVFFGRTPLWYYILKEAELAGGSRLGRVGSRIVAETLVGLVENSSPSIRKERDWRPTFGRHDAEHGVTHFEMIDLLNFADVVDPIGRLDAEFVHH